MAEDWAIWGAEDGEKDARDWLAADTMTRLTWTWEPSARLYHYHERITPKRSGIPGRRSEAAYIRLREQYIAAYLIAAGTTLARLTVSA